MYDPIAIVNQDGSLTVVRDASPEQSPNFITHAGVRYQAVGSSTYQGRRVSVYRAAAIQLKRQKDKCLRCAGTGSFGDLGVCYACGGSGRKSGRCEMMFPTVHLNGTAKSDLLEAIEQAHAAVKQAQKKLAETAPNGRDYYPQGPEAIYAAQNEHYARMQKLRDVELELEAIAEQITLGGRR